MVMTLIPAGSNVRVALGHHHGFYITCKIVLGKAGQQGWDLEEPALGLTIA